MQYMYLLVIVLFFFFLVVSKIVKIDFNIHLRGVFGRARILLKLINICYMRYFY